MIRKNICYIIYQMIGRYLPDNDGRITLGSTFIRRFLVKGFTGVRAVDFISIRMQLYLPL